MHFPQMRLTLVGMMIGAAALVGCSQEKTESVAPAAEAHPAPAATGAPAAGAPAAMEKTAETGETVQPAATAAEIWTQIADEQGKLSTAIQNGELKNVHHLAFGVRDLVVALAEKSTASSPAAAAQLKGLVDGVKASAGKLDELGDAGNLSGTQAEYAKLASMLDAIKTASGRM